MRVRVAPKDGAWVVDEAALAFGGMAATSKAAPAAQALLAGKPWAWGADAKAACEALATSDLPLPPTVPGGQPEYRSALAASFVYV